jgi:arylsulfatase
MKVILLVIDTLRADHLGCYNYDRATSPNIDRLANEGVIFENAYPTDVPTQPSFTSMFTGLRGIQTGIVSHSETENLSRQIPCFPEVLSQNGITTAAVSTLYMMRQWFARGYRHYMNPIAGQVNRTQQVNAEEINALALPWIEKNRDKDFFIFIHYWDPHATYFPPEPYRRLFYDGDETDPENTSFEGLKKQPVWPFTKRHLDFVRSGLTDAEYMVAQYDAEIRYADDYVGELLNLIEGLGINDETALILTSDHGESLREHEFYFDHHEVYETTIHVPLIIRYPMAVPEGKKVKDLVQSTIGLTPTVLNLFGIKMSKAMEGKDLVKIANGEETEWENIYVNQGLWTGKRAVRNKRWKLIKTLDKAFWETPEIELYNIVEDPEEIKNLASEEKEIVDDFELQMNRWLRSNLGKQIDPLEKIVAHGLPVYDWVKSAARAAGMLEKYEEWRIRVDRAETPQ